MIWCVACVRVCACTRVRMRLRLRVWVCEIERYIQFERIQCGCCWTTNSCHLPSFLVSSADRLIDRYIPTRKEISQLSKKKILEKWTHKKTVRRMIKKTHMSERIKSNIIVRHTQHTDREREYQAYQVCILYASRTLVINKTENRVV